MAVKIVASVPVKAESVVADMKIPTGFEQNLPFLSRALKISPNPNDYFFRAVPILISDLPNRNGVGMPLSELIKWNPQLKCQAYRSWLYAPMYEEHRSDVLEEALGVVADVALTPLRGFSGDTLWKVICLAAIDRTKNVSLAAEVESGELNTYSMGAMVSGYTCSYCGADEGKCRHIDPSKPVTFYELNGKLVYKLVYDISAYELSVVRDPAYPQAAHDGPELSYTEPSIKIRKP